MNDQVEGHENNHEHEHHVIVNGEEKTVRQHELSFHEVCKLAFPEGPFTEKVVYTVSFTLPDETEGVMVKVESIKVINGTIFVVGNSDQS